MDTLSHSACLLGFMYSFGHSIVKDGIEALRRLQYWLQKAAQNDDKAVAAKAREALGSSDLRARPGERNRENPFRVCNRGVIFSN